MQTYTRPHTWPIWSSKSHSTLATHIYFTLVERRVASIEQQIPPDIITTDVPSCCPVAQISIHNLQPETEAGLAETYIDEVEALASAALRQPLPDHDVHVLAGLVDPYSDCTK